MKNTLLLILCFFFACQNRNVIDNIESIPKVTPSDAAYANVFKILDGTWEGKFNIYEDTQRKSIQEVELAKLTSASLEKEGISLSNSIDVQQIYTSESPYFQRVTITDTYPETGETRN